MRNDDILKRVNNVFQEVFDDDTLEVDYDTTSDDIDDWDSLEHMTLMEAVEKEFDIRFKTSEIANMKNVGETVDIIARRAKK